jgi:hypothetical protein
MAKVFAKWIVEGSRAKIIDMIEDGEFYIQVFKDENDDDSDTLYCDDGDSNLTFKPVVGGRLDGCYEIMLTGPASGPILSPSSPEEATCYDLNGKSIGEAYEFGPVKHKTVTKVI